MDIVIHTSFFLLTVILYAVMSVHRFRYDQSLLQKLPKWFGPDAWVNKYKSIPDSIGPHKGRIMSQPKYNWYTKLFNLQNRERFPLSATVLVFLTDGFHFVQFLFITSLIVTILTFKFEFRGVAQLLWTALIYKALWSFVHEAFFSHFLIIKDKGTG